MSRLHSAPIRPEVREQMRRLAAGISKHLPENCGFALLVFDLGEGGYMNYISNADRADMVKALREFVEKEESVS